MASAELLLRAQIPKTRQAEFSPKNVLSCPLVSLPVTSCHIQCGSNAVSGKAHGMILSVKVTRNALRCSAGFLTCRIADFQSACTHATAILHPSVSIRRHDPKLNKTERF